jgi:flavin reductase (DIM6/NTAB) family NADH-FMN oxidoreductase RutF
MRIYLTNAGSVTLLEPTDFRRLDVLVDPQPAEQLERVIARLGSREDEGHVRLSPSVLRFISGHAGEAEWEKGFAAMMAYAAKAGWVDAQGNVRAHLTHCEADQVVSQDEFKAAMRSLPAGVSAITTGAGDDVAGMIVSSLTSISADPPLVGFFVNVTSSMAAPLLANGRFVANILSDEHSAVMSAFLGEQQGPDRFKRGNWIQGRLGLPVLADALASIECDIVNTEVLGTHRMIVGKIRQAHVNSANPMVHFNSCTHRLQGCEPIKEKKAA